jgi:hypothetical protein
VEHGLLTASVAALPHPRAGVAAAVLGVRALRLFMGTPFRYLDHIAVTRPWRNAGDATCHEGAVHRCGADFATPLLAVWRRAGAKSRDARMAVVT